MKYFIILLCSTIATAQVGLNTVTPSVAAAFDMNSAKTINYGGLKIPMVTEAERAQVTVTAQSEGTMLYVTYTNGDRCLEIYDGLQSVWQKINCTDDNKSLFISEYIEADSNNKYIELYNPTNTAIDLASYKILIFRNGGDFPIDGTDREIFLTGTIAANATFVIASSGQTLFAGTINLSVANNLIDFNGNDPVVLADLSNNVLDVVGILGTDPGAGYPVDGSFTVEETIRRISYVQNANPVWTPSEWRAFGLNNVSGLGSF